jgi:hypothetical protein
MQSGSDAIAPEPLKISGSASRSLLALLEPLEVA